MEESGLIQRQAKSFTNHHSMRIINNDLVKMSLTTKPRTQEQNSQTCISNTCIWKQKKMKQQMSNIL